MKRGYYLIVLLMLTAAWGCSGGSSDKAAGGSGPEAVQPVEIKKWKKEANRLYKELAYYYNNNIHDSLVMKVPEVLEYCRKHELWADYYDTWMLLGQEYNFSGETNMAIKVAKEIHDDATKRDNHYGLTVAEYIKGLVYDNQINREEASRSFERALASYPPDADAFLKNSIYVYYATELKGMEDTLKMRKTLDEWAAYLNDCRRDTTIAPIQFDNWLYYYHHSCYYYYMMKKDWDRAEMHVDSVVKHIEAVGWSKITRNEVLAYRTQLAIERKQYAEALKLSNQQMPEGKELDMNAYAGILKQRARILSGIGQWKEAYKSLEEQQEMLVSVNQEETRKQLNELNKRFELDELRAQQERDKIQQERETMQHERQRMYLMIVIGAIVVIAIATYIILRQRDARRLAEVKAERERMEGELRIARDIQMSMVPSTFPNRQGLDMYASMAPAREVGGDLYGYVVNGDMLYFCVGDVSGKGVPSSLFMAQATRLFQMMAKQGLQPAEICTRMNDALSGDDNENGMFVTFFLGLINLNSGHLSFCNAGHNPPVIGGSASHGDYLEMESNAPLGLWAGLKYIGEEIDSIKGRPLFIYTDGLNEAENQQQQQFGDERLLSMLRNTHFESSQQVIETLAAEVEQHRNGAEPNDDLTMMCIRVAI